MIVVGIDPGVSGAIVVTDGKAILEVYPMPIEKEGNDVRVDYRGVIGSLLDLTKSRSLNPAQTQVFLERAVSFGMGTKSAFNYGRGFEATVIAITAYGMPYTLVEPGKWTKEMHAGISADLKPKAKSLIAVKRLYPQLVAKLPTKPKGGLMDGPVDALLIAGYGLRQLAFRWEKPINPNDDQFDFL